MNESQRTPEHNDPEISASMRRIVPNDMTTSGLVAGARVKRHRRQGFVGALAALALVAVAVPVALNLPNSNTMMAEPANSSSTAESMDGGTVPALPGAEACYIDGVPLDPAQTADGPAPMGAVRAWLCGDYSPDTGLGVVGPVEPLTTGLDTLITDVQAADDIDLAVTTCERGEGGSFSAVFEYDDGSTHVIRGEHSGCRATYDGGVTRVGAEEFHQSLYSAWEAQRADDTGDWMRPGTCPGPVSIIAIKPSDAEQGSVCSENPDGSRSATYLDDDLLKEVGASTQAALDEKEGSAEPLPPAAEQRVWLTLSNRFTDHLNFVRHEDGRYRAYDAMGMGWWWEPSEDLSSRLDAALAGAGSADVPPAGQPIDPTVNAGGDPQDPVLQPEQPKPFVPEDCSLTEDAPSELPGGLLPDGAESVRLCPSNDFGGATPLEPLIDVALVSGAVAAFNDLSLAPEEQACTMELGPAYTAVYSYVDGTRHTVELQEYGCRNVVSGAVVKADSDGFKETLSSLWEKQRDGYQPKMERPAPLCPLTGSMFAVVPGEEELTSGVACASPLDPAPDALPGSTFDGTPVPDELLKEISTQLASPSPEMMDLVPTGDSLVLLTAWGDPLVLQRLEDGSFTALQDGESFSWTPSGDVATGLDALFGG